MSSKRNLATVSGKAVGRSILEKEGAKVAARTISKAAGKAVAKTAGNPLMFIADGVEIATEYGAREFGCDKTTAKTVGKGAGLAASVGIGGAIGGPVGAVAGVAVWGFGELIGLAFDD
jgi:hypothetical protein